MNKNRNSNGFTVIELLIISAVLGTLIIISSGGISGFFAERRSIDSLTNTISTQLNFAKFLAYSTGVQHRFVINIIDPENLEIDILRGDSNINSDDALFVGINDTDPDDGDDEPTMLKTNEKLNIFFPANIATVTFNPDGTILDDDGNLIEPTFDAGGNLTSLGPSIHLGPEDPTGAKITKCGKITITPFKGIGTIIGRWDETITDPDDPTGCKPITDVQEAI